jgi:hypothetical protein
MSEHRLCFKTSLQIMLMASTFQMRTWDKVQPLCLGAMDVHRLEGVCLCLLSEVLRVPHAR